MESELKLRVEPDNVGRLKDHPLLAQYCRQPPQQTDMTATYYDTPDLLIRQAKAHLRVRQSHQRWRQTFKAELSTLAGLHRREEWETFVDGPEPDLEQLRQQIGCHVHWQPLLQHLEQQLDLQPLFSTQVSRTVWNLHLPTGEEVEAALDEGSLTCGDLSLPIGELELELRSGQPASLFRLALELIKVLPLRLDNRSKPDLGYALLARQTHPAVKATALSLSADSRVEQAFRAVISNCLAQVQANEPGVAKSRAPDSLHQMRVGLRRLRSALRLFERAIPCPASLQTQLEELTAQLGVARDWDVLLGSTLPWASTRRDDPRDLTALRHALAEQATQAHQAASRAVTSPAYSELLLAFGAWLEERPWRDAPDGDPRRLDKALDSFADKRLKQAHGRLLRRARGLKQAEPQRLHRLRIAAKRLRYACEFFQSLYPKRRLCNYVEALSGLQDELGKLNDAHVAEALLDRLLPEQPALQPDVDWLKERLVALQADEIKPLRQRWKQFKRIKRPWKR
ncbi:MAG: CHAD domain-containing protein [Pseudomonas sp.]|uniref:CYTH and CHAD domain-containing protein n=1 Tax=Pseudomonas sp. TaxID=306 RepID=UPI003396428D